MTIAAIRKKLMTYIADADAKKVKGLYLLIADEMNNGESFNLSKDQVKLLDDERKKHVNGKSKSYSWDEAKEVIRGKRKM